MKSLQDFLNKNFGSLEKTSRLDLGLRGSLQVSGSFLSIASNLILDAHFHLTVKNSIICIDDIDLDLNPDSSTVSTTPKG